MGPQRYILAQAYNNAWANHRLLKACALLSAADLDAPRQSFFPSIIHTLNHILTVDWLYVGALEGHCPGASAFEPQTPFPAIADLDREQRAVDRRMIDHCRRRARPTSPGKSGSRDKTMSRSSVPIEFCCTSSSTRSIIAARCMRCCLPPLFPHRSSTSSFRRTRRNRHCAQKTSPNSALPNP